jgi:uncharacterized protein (TIGR03437 family)
VTNTPASGAVAPSSPLSTTTAIPRVTVGGVSAQVLFSGLAPGSVGEYQINILVPANAPSGSADAVVVTIAGAVSNTVTMAIK